jgi:hypothetical protein
MAGSNVQRKGKIHVGREDVTRCACLRFEKNMNLIRANTRIRTVLPEDSAHIRVINPPPKIAYTRTYSSSHHNEDGRGAHF